MNITVDFHANPNPNGAVAAYASILLGDLIVVHDVRLIRRRPTRDNPDGLFVAMPSKKLGAHCPQCQKSNHLLANFCNECGTALTHGTPPSPDKWYADICHPISPEGRRMIFDAVTKAHRDEGK